MRATSSSAPSWNLPALESTLPKHVLAGSMRYQGFAPLGKGGKAEVFRCRDIYLDRDVAYKVLHHSLAPRSIEQQMLFREARIMASLRSRAVPAVHEVGRDRNGLPYFTMELVESQSLHEILQQARDEDPDQVAPFGIEQLVAVVARVAEALGEAHQAGVVHGDVKPENILVDARGHVSLIDWGLARIVQQARGNHQGESVDQAWGRQGSALFMSPEQAAREPFLTPASDIYSLGAVLYECLTLGVPFRGADSDETLRRVLTDTPAPPSEAAPERRLPAGADQLCLKALAKQPEDRFASMAEFAAQVTDVLHEALISFERDDAFAVGV